MIKKIDPAISKFNYSHSIPRGSIGQEKLNYIQVPVPGRVMKWGIILVSCGVHQGLVLQQQFYHLQVPKIACFMLIRQNQ